MVLYIIHSRINSLDKIMISKTLCSEKAYALLILRSRGLFEKLTGSKLVKKFPTFDGSRSFITAFTRIHQLSVFWARSIQSMPHPSAWRPSLILSSHLHLGLLNGLIPSSLPHTNPVCSSPPYVLHATLIQRKLVFLCRSVGASSFQRLLSADITGRRKQLYFLGGK